MIMIIKYYLSIVVLLVLLTKQEVYAQETETRNKQEKGFFNITELGYYAGVNDRKTQIDQRTIARSVKDVYTLSLRNITGVFLTNKISLGVGVGLDGFQVKNSDFYNTFQLFGMPDITLKIRIILGMYMEIWEALLKLILFYRKGFQAAVVLVVNLW